MKSYDEGRYELGVSKEEEEGKGRTDRGRLNEWLAVYSFSRLVS